MHHADSIHPSFLLVYIPPPNLDSRYMYVLFIIIVV